MAYNPYDSTSALYKLKNIWSEANAVGDEQRKNNAAADAQRKYKELRDNGYVGLADELEAAGLDDAKKINDKYGKMGKTELRPYMYSIGQSYGLSRNEVDKLLKYDNDTGEVSFGGMNIGKPYAVVDGRSYIDKADIDNAFENYKNTANLTLSYDTLSKRSGEAYLTENKKFLDDMYAGNKAESERYDEYYNHLYNDKPLEGSEAKKILQGYSAKGENAALGALASGAAANGGNIDSSASAHAQRLAQEYALEGNRQVYDNWNRRMDNVLAGLQTQSDSRTKNLSLMGNQINGYANASQMFAENHQNELNGEVSRAAKIAEVTGVVPASMRYSSNPFFNADGTLKDESIDYKTEIEKAVANGNTELANQLRVARGAKIFGDYTKYGRFNDGDYLMLGEMPTEDARVVNEQIAQADRAIDAEAKMNDANNQNKIDQINTSAKYGTTTNKSGGAAAAKPTLTAAQAMNAIKNGEVSQAVIDAYNDHYGTDYTVDNLPAVSSKTKPTVTDKEISNFVKKVNDYAQEHFGTEKTPITAVSADISGGYSVNDVLKNYVIGKIMEKNYDAVDLDYVLTLFGLDEDDVYEYLNRKR